MSGSGEKRMSGSGEKRMRRVGRRAMSKPNCLVVEDEPGIGWAIRRLLEQAGASVTVAASGGSALEYLARDKLSIIFLDVKLPDTDGFELAGKIRAIAPAIPIVMISAYFYPSDPKVRQMLDHGVARRFIAKPFRHEELLDALRDLVAPAAPWSANHSLEATACGASSRNPSPQRKDWPAQPR
jgi:CheY-like chemotaxis protein